MAKLGTVWILLSLLAPAAWGGTAVAGRSRVELVAPPGVEVEPYSNSGYELRREGDRIHIAVDARPLGSTAAFRLPPEGSTGAPVPIDRLARGLTAGAGNHYDAVSRILDWISTQVAYDLDRGAPQDAAAVLERRSAYCTGFARASVALLRAAGIPAREVAGIVLEEGHHGGAQFHRWIEVYYPLAGWAFSDPVRSHHYVPATYLRLASSKVRVGGSPSPRLSVRQGGDLVAVDVYPHGSSTVSARRNTEAQRASALRITTPRDLELEAVLEGAGRRQRLALKGGGGTFLGLDPGSYRLRLVSRGSAVLQGRLRMDAGERQWLRLSEPPGLKPKEFESLDIEEGD